MRLKNILKTDKELDNLLGPPPIWIVRWGITILAGIIVILLVGSYFFRYPEVISTPITLTHESPATWIVAKINGRIDSIYIKENSFVRKGQIIASLENTSEAADVYALKKELAQFYKNLSKNQGNNLHIQKNLHVGELNELYTNLIKLVDEFSNFRNENYYSKKIAFLNKERELKQNLEKNIQKQLNTFSSYSSIENKQYTRDSILTTKGINPKTLQENTKKQILSSDIKVNDYNSSLIHVNIDINKIQETAEELKLTSKEKERSFINNLFIAYEALYNGILNWESAYILRAPTNGTIEYFNYWSENQNVVAGEKVFSIIPYNKGLIVGKCLINSTGIGEIKKGNNVIIKLNEFPYLKYGILNGHVSRISSLGLAEQNSKEKLKNIEVVLDTKDLVTSYGENITKAGELTGIAEISINDISLLENFFAPLKYLSTNFKKNTPETLSR
ncbi:HlyD family efflux transporter periplasmic adaptor subunit [Sphingobacterium faecium]|uniref:HlyD family efflux transporter periplasmic adaptor subunit n=1 Tax=Sphingobacterium faecium TaxID=34087 RepID=UPI00320965EF